MRRLLLIVAILFLLPVASAESKVYITNYGANYTLGEDEFSVSERITFKNEGDIFKGTIFLLRGDAQDVEVSIDKTYIWKSDYSVGVENGITVIRFPNLVIAKGSTRELTLQYTRTDLLGRKDSFNVFTGPIVASLPWNILNVDVGIVAPEGYQFGDSSLISPVDFEVSRTIESRRDVITYRLRNLPEDESLTTELDYADFESLALERLSIAEEYVEDALSAVGNANKTIANAEAGGADVEVALSIYEDAVSLLEEADYHMRVTNNILATGEWAGFKVAYESATRAQEAAKDAQNSALSAASEANFAIQKVLEERIDEMGTNLAEESKLLTEDLSKKLEELKGIEKEPVVVSVEKEVGISRTRYIVEILVLVLVAFVALNVARVRERKIERVGKVDDFRVIDDLKRKEFKGFDKKVDKVKRGVEVAKEIRKLKRKRQKHAGEIETFRKKKVEGELPNEEFAKKKRNLSRRIDRIDSKVDELEKKLKEVREVK